MEINGKLVAVPAYLTRRSQIIHIFSRYMFSVKVGFLAELALYYLCSMNVDVGLVLWCISSLGFKLNTRVLVSNTYVYTLL